MITRATLSTIEQGLPKYRSMLAGNPAYNPFTVQLAYDAIDSVYVNPDTTTITFSSIPQTYSHLELRIYSKVTRNGTSDNLYYRFNGDSGSNYVTTAITRAAGGTIGVSTNGIQTFNSLPDCIPGNSTGNTGVWGYQQIRITDYNKTDRWKQSNSYFGWITATPGTLGGRVGYASNTWQNTAAVTQIVLTTSAPTFLTGSYFALYGIKQGL